MSHLPADDVAEDKIGPVMCFCATGLRLIRCSRQQESLVTHHCPACFSCLLISQAAVLAAVCSARVTGARTLRVWHPQPGVPQGQDCKSVRHISSSQLSYLISHMPSVREERCIYLAGDLADAGPTGGEGCLLALKNCLS